MHSSIQNALRHLRPEYMPFSFRTVHEHQRDASNACKPNTQHLPFRLADVFLRIWDLGFTAFGGPPVHFQILHQRFVESRGAYAAWVDEQTYRELFALAQALPGPGSTKMLFTLVAYHAGLVCAIFAFLVWSLPGAIGMFLLSIGVGKIKDVLPGPVYGLLSGLNASTVGIIALAAVQLATKAIVDPLSRILVIFGACAGLCYTALWYFPALVGIGGVVAVVWDLYLSRAIGRFRAKRQQRRINQQRVAEESSSTTTTSIPLQDMSSIQASSSRRIATSQEQPTKQLTTNAEAAERIVEEVPESQNHTYTLSLWQSISIFFLFFASFAAVLAARGALSSPPLILDLFANMYLAGTIIFGGGPVVIPLLREYTVQPGWVSPRDFLIGLAIIQAFPGPNFNFAVYLGALAVSSHAQGLAGAVLGFIGIFLPGLALSTAVSGIWQIVRTKALVVSVLRGINATAVGLVFTAVYRLWEIGYLTPDSGRGKSLANDPWWVVVAAVAYSGTAWFKIPPALAILAGAVLGLCWYGVAGKQILGL
ncbi:chromate transporter, partial [Aureobasidium melanogenum]